MSKKIFTVVLALTFMMSGVVCGCGKVFVSKSESTIEQFIEAVNEENYDEAEAMIYFSNTIQSDSSFSAFAKNHLQNLTYEMQDDKKSESIALTLKSDTDTFNLTLNQIDDSYRILADDFVMDYQVQYISCFSSSHNNFCMNGEYLGDGIKQYTVYTYKKDQVTLNHDMILEETSLAPNIKTVVAFDENYEPSEIVSVADYLDDSETMPGFVTIKDGIIFIDTYYITEAYTQTLARNFSDVMEDIVNTALSGSDYSEFSSSTWNKSLFDTNSKTIKDCYEGFTVAAKHLNRNLDYKIDDMSWNYDEKYHLGDSYIMTITMTLSAYSNGKQSKKAGSATYYVKYKADEKSFIIADIGDTYDSVA